MKIPSSQISHQLANEKIGRLIWKYSLPSIVGTLIMSMYNVVDRIFLGQGVGALAISGLALTFPFMILLLAVGMLIGAGSASRISITLGEGDTEKSEKILANAFILTFIITGSVIVISYIFMDKILILFGGTEATTEYAREFMQIIIPANIFTALNFGFNNIMRASGYPKKAMLTMIICSILNAIFAALFIFVFKWGIRGAALATTLAYIVGSVWVLSHFMQKNVNIRFRRKNFRLEKNIVLSILSIGMSPFSMQLATCVVVILINSVLLRYGGDLAIGAYGIINSIMTLTVMIIIGLNQGTQPIIGYNYGAKLYHRVFTALKKGIFIGTVISSIGFILGEFFSYQIVSLFTTDPDLQHIAANAIRIGVFVFPIIGAQIVITNFFQSIGKAKISIFLSLTRQVLFLIPGLIILPRFWQLNGVWAAMPVSDLLSTTLSLVTIFYFVHRFKKAELIK